MRWIPAVALCLCIAALPACAQHGGGGHGGGGFGGGGGHAGGFGGGGFHGGGGFGGRGISGFGGGGGAGGRSGFTGRARFGAPVGRSGYGAPRSTGFASGYPVGRGFGVRSAPGSRAGGVPFGGSRGGDLGGHGPWRAPYRGRGYGYGYGYRSRYGYPVFAYPAYVSLGLWDPYLDFADYDGFNGSGAFYDSYDSYDGSNGYAGDAQPAVDAYQPQGYPTEGDPQASGAAGYPASAQDGGVLQEPAQPADSGPMVYAPGIRRQGTGQPANPPLHQEALLTLFFRDGRPPEKIRNYALTRTSILLSGETLREIPLRELDLATTERVNRAAGVDFRLP